MTLLREGQGIRDTYEVERFLGEGAFAEVYRVRHRFLGRQAIKVFKMVGMTMQEIEGMLGEAIILSRIGHPNIVRVFDANVTETSRGTCGFFTMEYIAGGSLEQFWRSHGAQFVPVETSVEILRQVCRGLALAHGESPPIVHRDIKPQNVLVGYDSNGLRALLSDFGLAKQVNPLTLLASARGTRCFKAPETLRDLQSDSCAGDVWALGCTLYLLLTDRLPYLDASGDDMDPRRFERPLVAPSRLNPQVDPGLDRIAMRALAIDPGQRPGNARVLLEELDRWRPRGLQAAEKTAPLPGALSSKSALGQASPADERRAARLAAQALELARGKGRFAEAADLMEEAFNACAEMRERYAYQVRLWRRGVAM